MSTSKYILTKVFQKAVGIAALALVCFSPVSAQESGVAASAVRSVASDLPSCPDDLASNELAFSCRCAPDPAGWVYGTDVYTGDSNICLAAVHAGVIEASVGGLITVKPETYDGKYAANDQNGVQSQSWGPYQPSFSVSGFAEKDEGQKQAGSDKRRPDMISEPDVATIETERNADADDFPKLEVNKIVQEGTKIIVRFIDPNPGSRPWITIVEAGSDGAAFNDFEYTEGKTSGEVYLDPLSPGAYEVRFHSSYDSDAPVSVARIAVSPRLKTTDNTADTDSISDSDSENVSIASGSSDGPEFENTETTKTTKPRAAGIGEMAFWNGEIKSKSIPNWQEPITVSFSQGAGYGEYRSIRYMNPGCLYDLISVGSNVWEERLKQGGGKCANYGGDRLLIESMQNGDLTIERVHLKNPDQPLRGSATLRANSLVEFCPLSPKPCPLWAMKSLATAKSARASEIANLGDTDDVAVNEDDGTRKPLIGNWQDCGRPYELKTKLPQDTSLNYKSFTVDCVANHLGPKWVLKISDTDFGSGYDIADARVGMIVDAVGSHSFGYYGIEEILAFIANMGLDHVSKITLIDPNKDCNKIDCKYIRTSVSRRHTEKQLHADLTIDGDNQVGFMLNLFLRGDFLGLEDELDKAAKSLTDNPAASTFLGPARSLVPEVAQFLENEIYRTAYQSRFSHFMTNYILMRVTLLGGCSEPMTGMKWTETRWIEYRDGYGNYRGSSTPISEVTDFVAPVGFVPLFDKVPTIEVEPWIAELLAGQIRQLGCDDPRRSELETNMLRFYEKDY